MKRNFEGIVWQTAPGFTRFSHLLRSGLRQGLVLAEERGVLGFFDLNQRRQGARIQFIKALWSSHHCAFALKKERPDLHFSFDSVRPNSQAGRQKKNHAAAVDASTSTSAFLRSTRKYYLQGRDTMLEIDGVNRASAFLEVGPPPAGRPRNLVR